MLDDVRWLCLCPIHRFCAMRNLHVLFGLGCNCKHHNLMRAIFLLPLFGSAALAQLTDPSFELGTFNSAIRSGPTATFVNIPAQAYSGDSFGAISAVAPSTGALRTLTSFEAGLVEPGASYSFSFYAKRPETNGFTELAASASGGGPDALVSRQVLEAPSSLTAVWMIYSYQFNIPLNWNPENIFIISLKTEPISPVVFGQTYSFNIDNFSLTKIDVASIPEPQTWALGAGLAAMTVGVVRRRRSSF